MTTSAHPKDFLHYGKVKHVCREAGLYVKTLPTPSDPNGSWGKLTEHGHYVDVATNDRKLADVVAAVDGGSVYS